MLPFPSNHLRPPAHRFCLSGSIPNPHFGENPKPPENERKETNGVDNEQKNTGGLKRTVQLKFRVTEAERDMIFEKMCQLRTNNLAAYLRKVAIDGYVIAVDNSDIKAMTAEIQKIGVNINQIARRVNTTGRIYEQDIEEIKRAVDEIWRLQRLSLLKQR